MPTCANCGSRPSKKVIKKTVSAWIGEKSATNYGLSMLGEGVKMMINGRPHKSHEIFNKADKACQKCGSTNWEK